MAENGPSRKRERTGGCGAVFAEPEAGSLCVSGSWRCVHLQQSGRERHLALCGRQEELAVLRQCQGSGIQCHRLLAGGDGQSKRD